MTLRINSKLLSFVLIICWQVIFFSGLNAATKSLVRTSSIATGAKALNDVDFNTTQTCNIVEFTPVVSGTGPFQYLWDFGDGATSTDANSTHTFDICNGNTHVKLVVTDISTSEKDSAEKTITLPVPALSFFDSKNNPVNNRPDRNFNRCNSGGSGDFQVALGNSSTNTGCVTHYVVDWGDGTPTETVTNADFPIPHSYSDSNRGTFTLTVTAYWGNNCSETVSYQVVNMTKPRNPTLLGPSWVGSAYCIENVIADGGVEIWLGGWGENDPGTEFFIEFGDGITETLLFEDLKASSYYNASNPLTSLYPITYMYDRSSCEVIGAPSYTARVVARNSCGESSPGALEDIIFSMKPEARFDASEPICIDKPVTFINTSLAGFTGGDRCESVAEYIWDFGDGTPPVLIERETPSDTTHTYTQGGNFTVKLMVNNDCGASEYTYTVCVDSVLRYPPSFALDNNKICKGESITATNTSPVEGCNGSLLYNWDVIYQSGNCGTEGSYTYGNGTSGTSRNAHLTFSNPGVYNIRLRMENACKSDSSAWQQIVVTQPPVVNIDPASLSGHFCDLASISPVALIDSCGSLSLTYNWEFPGGTPSTSTNRTPGEITYGAPGKYPVRLRVTGGCGITLATDTVIIYQTPKVTNTLLADTLCSGSASNNFVIISDIVGTTFEWTASVSSSVTGYELNGTSNIIPGRTLINTGSVQETITYTITPTANGCTGTPAEYTITVNPTPEIILHPSDAVYCLNESPFSPLEAGYGKGGTATASYQWYSNTSGSNTGGTLIPGANSVTYTPPTDVADTFYYYCVISFIPAYCSNIVSDAARIVVHPRPEIHDYMLTINTGEVFSLVPVDGDDGNVVPAGTQYKWNMPVSDPPGAVGGGTAQPILQDIISQTLTNTWTTDAEITYTVTPVFEGCEGDPFDVKVIVRLDIDPRVTVTHISCFEADNGKLESDVIGGKPPYSYEWRGLGASLYTAPYLSGNESIDALAAGTYWLIVSDINGVKDTTSYSIQQPDPVTVALIKQNNVSCNGGADGSIEVTVSGGTTGYSYQWKKDGTDYSTDRDIYSVSAGTYILTITDANGCEKVSDAYIVTQPDPLAVSLNVAASSLHLDCYGNATGLIAVNVTGGTPALGEYDFLWTGSNGYTSTNKGSITGLKAGKYWVTVTDSLGCTATISDSIAIVEPDELIITLYSKTDISCHGSSDGEIVLSVTGGTSPYNYSWSNDGSHNNSMYTNLPAGTYIIRVTDAKGCDSTLIVELNEQDELQVSLYSKANVSCFGGSNGAVTVSTSGGTYPYSYEWYDAAGNAILPHIDSIHTSLSAGTYEVRVTDALGCTDTIDNILVTQPGLLEVSLDTVVHVRCYEESTGKIEVSVTGGTPAFGEYEFSWTGPDGYTNNDKDSIVHLKAGVYSLTVTDSVGCVFTQNDILVEQPADGLKTSCMITHVNCYGGNNGSITVSVSGGVAPYTYIWYDDNSDILPYTESSRSDLPAGNYTIVVTDAQLCTSTQLVTITEPPLLEASVDSLNSTLHIKCYGDSTGIITVSVTGGTPYSSGTYTYLWKDDTKTLPFTTGEATGLPAGNYTILVTDSLGCDTTVTVTLTQPSASLNLTVDNIVDVLCFGESTGKIAVSVTGGTPDLGEYEFEWTYPDGSTHTNKDSIVHLKAGSYNLTVTDSAGCVITQSNIEVKQPDAPLTTSYAVTNVSCSGGSDGSIEIFCSSGVYPYTYTWYDDALNPLAQPPVDSIYTNFRAGFYTVVVTDNNGCINTLSNIEITEPPLLEASIDVSNSILHIGCYGESTGTIIISAIGGTPSANGNYKYTWSNDATLNAPVQSNLPAGTYMVTVTDSLNCDTTVTVILTQPVAPLNLTVDTVVNVFCFGESTGKIEVTVTGGTPTFGEYEFSWTGPDGYTSTDKDSIVNLIAGSYNLTVSDSVGCFIAESNIEVKQPDAPLTTSYAVTNVSCSGGSDGSIEIFCSSGIYPYTYTWYDDALHPLAQPPVDSIYTNLRAGFYTVVVTDNNGCINTLSNIEITEPPLLEASIDVSNSILHIGCYGESTGTIIISAIGGTPSANGNYKYTWSNDATLNAPVQSNLPAGTYTVTVTDSLNCDTTVTVILTQPVAPLNLTVDTVVNVFCFGESTGKIEVTVTGGTPAFGEYEFSWTGPDGYTNNDKDSIVHLIAGSYNLIVTDSVGCFITQSNIEVKQPDAPLTTNHTVKNVSCLGGDDGSIEIFCSSGIYPYTYTWYDDALNPLAQPPVDSIYANLRAGFYTVVVTDNNGCINTLSNIEITEPPLLEASVDVSSSVLHIDCYGDSTGKIVINVTGGTSYSSGTYTYLWKNDTKTLPFTTGEATGLPAGNYTILVTDSLGCDTTVSVTLTQPAAPLNLTVDNIVDVLCFGNSTGKIAVSVTGGTPDLGEYEFEWTYLDGSTHTNKDSIVHLKAGIYQLTVTDSAGCFITQSDIEVKQPDAPLTTSYAVTNVSCSGGSDGSIEIFCSSGIYPYTYTWYDDALNPLAQPPVDSIYTNLRAGFYTIVVTDNNGCINTLSNIEITEPPLLEASIDVSNSILHIGCYGESTGTIIISAIGGTPSANGNYKYTWSNDATLNAPVQSNLPAGTYTVTVTDSLNCDTTVSVTLTQPSDLLNLTVDTVVNVLCFGESTGKIAVSVTGGTPDLGEYEFEWTYPDGSTHTNKDSIVHLKAGSYNLTVSDSVGCFIAESNIEVKQPDAPLTTSYAVTNVSCSGGSDGSIEIFCSSGVYPYTYTWYDDALHPLAQPPVDSIYTNFRAGFYTIVVTDNNGCINTLSNIEITEPPLLEASIDASSSVLHIDCYGDSTGIIIVSVTGGTPYSSGNYTYLWQDDTKTLPFTTGETTGLPAGNYTVEISDSLGCDTTVTVTLTQPAAPLNLTVDNIVDVLCFGNSTGKIEVSVSGGTPDLGEYEFEWTYPDGSTHTDKDSIVHLIAGSYNLTVTDSVGCFITESNIEVKQPGALLTTSYAVKNVSCLGGDDGSIEISASGGTAPYSYSWSNDGSYNSAIYSNLSVGNYTILVTDANGCESTEFVTIIEPELLEAEIDSVSSVLHIDCYGDSTGIITVSVTGGTPYSSGTYTYLWKDDTKTLPFTTGEATGLPAGNYTILVTDSLGCDTTVSVTLTQPAAPLNLTVDNIVDVLCFGNSTGKIEVSVSGGTPDLGEYEFEWTYPDGSTHTDKDSIVHLIAGSYNLTVTDSVGCFITESNIEVKQPGALLTTNHTVKNVSCLGGDDGSIEISASGGTAPYSYSWSNDASYNSAIYSNLPAGNYTILVTDANGCETTEFVTITEPPLLGASVNVSNSVLHIGCYGESTGKIAISVTGGTPFSGGNYTYTWSNDAAHNASVQSNLPAGTYMVTVTDSLGCDTTVTVILTQSPGFNIALESVTHLGCNADFSGAIKINVTGGTPLSGGGYVYHWTGPDAYTSTEKDPSGLAAGTYSVEVTDSYGCMVKIDDIRLTEPDKLQTVATVTPMTCTGFSDGAIKVETTGGSAPYTYRWNNSATGSEQDNLSAGTYSVYVTDANGCKDTVTAIIPEIYQFTMNPVVTQITCFGANNGSINLNLTAPVLPALKWNDHPTAGSQRNNLGPGVYTVVINEGSPCAVTRSFTIVEPAVLIVSSDIIPASACQANSGAIHLTVNGGKQPYTYLWSNGETSKNLENISEGYYFVEITDANGCMVSREFTVQKYAGIDINVSSILALGCDENAIVEIFTAQAGGGTAPYNYTWSRGTSSGTYNETMQTAYGGPASVTVTDATGCEATYSFMADISVPQINSNIINCNERLYQFSVSIPEKFAPNYSIVWNFNDGNYSTGKEPQHAFSQSGVYAVELQLVNPSCSITINKTIVVQSTPTLYLDKEAKFCKGDSVLLYVSGADSYMWYNGKQGDHIVISEPGSYSVTGITDEGCSAVLNFEASYFDDYNYRIYTNKESITPDDPTINVWSDDIPFSQYNWDFGDGTVDYGNNLYHTYNVQESGYIDIKLQVTNPDGCLEELIKRIWVTLAYMPNTFTPNGDGINDIFMKGWHIQVYNRNGQILYEGRDGWDGTYGGKPVKNDTYFYVVVYYTPDGGSKHQAGYITIIR